MNNAEIQRVVEIYNHIISLFDSVLIGQNQVKKAVATAMLCDNNSKILFTGNTGTGKTSLAKFLATSFNAQRMSITSDMIPNDIQNQLKNSRDMDFLQIDEFNRASGKVLSTFIELFEEQQMTIDKQRYSFQDFYVLATQNGADIAGVFNIPQAVYDRFDLNVYFDKLSEEEKRKLFFGNFIANKESDINKEDLMFTKHVVDSFTTTQADENIVMQIFNLIDDMSLNNRNLFAGSNIRAHKFALKLAKLNALINGRDYILPTDIAQYMDNLYKHRIDQNVARINDQDVEDKFSQTKEQILRIKRGNR